MHRLVYGAILQGTPCNKFFGQRKKRMSGGDFALFAGTKTVRVYACLYSNVFKYVIACFTA